MVHPLLRNWAAGPLVPLLLITLAFVFCIVATTSKGWAHRAMQTSDVPSFAYTEHRSPVYNCVWEDNNNFSSPTDPPMIEDCTNWARCSQRENYNDESDTDLLCAWLDNSFNLLMSANAFWAVAFFLSLVAAAASAPVADRGRHTGGLRRRRHQIVRVVSLPLFVMCLCGVIMLLLSQTLGTVGLLLVQKSQGDFTLTNMTVVQDGITPWLPGAAQVYLFVSWMAGILGIVAIFFTFEMPRVHGYRNIRGGRRELRGEQIHGENDVQGALSEREQDEEDVEQVEGGTVDRDARLNREREEEK
ncbi:hypothetical protein LTR34_008794 [Exophiala xenobiotica]|nr:hypothetical protein LTR34_008794 [Exophiala xenobiotica]KAK5552601.1 hypothetical protein LTR46_009339 [Exophiala xenobiotica]